MCRIAAYLCLADINMLPPAREEVRRLILSVSETGSLSLGVVAVKSCIILFVKILL